MKESLIKVYFAITPEGRGPTAVIISVKRREEIRKSVGDLLKLLAPQARKPKKQKLMFLLRFFFFAVYRLIEVPCTAADGWP